MDAGARNKSTPGMCLGFRPQYMLRVRKGLAISGAITQAIGQRPDKGKLVS